MGLQPHGLEQAERLGFARKRLAMAYYRIWLVFAFITINLASGLAVYFIISNLVGLAIQYLINRTLPMPQPATGAASKLAKTAVKKAPAPKPVFLRKSRRVESNIDILISLFVRARAQLSCILIGFSSFLLRRFFDDVFGFWGAVKERIAG